MTSTVHGRIGALAIVLCVGAATASPPTEAAAQTQEGQAATVIRVLPDEENSPVTPALMGTNHRTNENAHGMWDPERERVDPTVVQRARQAGLGLVRFPGGTEANIYDWKRAIGPAEERGCQIDARSHGDGPMNSNYGPDEHMRFLESLEGEAVIMTPLVGSTPADAADWVEYMNAPVGTNPNGGTAWAEVRAANGHPDSYGVTRWEIGNEHDRLVERYWMSEENARAMRQYAFGGTQRQLAQPVAQECDHRDRASISDGGTDQDFQVRYPPVVPDSQTVYVDGTAWEQVSNLGESGPGAAVYEFDADTGAIRFGDGAHGRIPPTGARVTADYDSGPHAGFVDFYSAMKAVDPGIDVCSNWAPVTAKTGLGGQTFPELMDVEGHADQYDCVTTHPYTNFGRDFDNGRDNPWENAAQGHDQHMIGDDLAMGLVDDLAREVKRHGRKDAYVAVSEFGALWGPRPTDEPFRDWNTSMSHALYMASQWADYANRGIPWTVGNALTDTKSLRTVLGPVPEFVYTSEAVVREAMRPLVAVGSTTIANTVDNNPVRQGTDGSYDGLATTATKSSDGHVRVLVVNRLPFDAVDARLVVAGREDGTATVSTVAAQSFTSFNSADHPDEVTLARDTRSYSGSLDYTFPAHSVTVLTF